MPVTSPAAMSTRIVDTMGWSATMPSASPAASRTARNPPAMSNRRIRAVITSGRFGEVHRHVNCAAAAETSHATAMPTGRAAGHTAATLRATAPTRRPSHTARWASHSRVSPHRRKRTDSYSSIWNIRAATSTMRKSRISQTTAAIATSGPTNGLTACFPVDRRAKTLRRSWRSAPPARGTRSARRPRKPRGPNPE